MNIYKIIRNTTATVAFTAFGIMSPAVYAGATYSANAFVSIALTGVSGENDDSDNVSVSFENAVTQQLAAGGGKTNFVGYPGSPALDMLIGDSLEQNQLAFGEAGSSFGTASSLVESQGLITMTNQSANPVFFDFAYSIQAAADVATIGNAIFSDAFAESTVSILDQFSAFPGIEQILRSSLADGVSSPGLNISGSFRIPVSQGTSNTLRVSINNNGGANFVPVPEPQTLVLLIAGLMFGIAARRSVPTLSAKGISPDKSWG